MIRKTTRNVWIQAVSGIRIVTCCLTCAALLLGSSHDVLAQKNKDKVPPGNPFQALQRQIDELRAQQGNGEFEQLRVFNPDPTQASTLFWGPTDDCTIGIDPPGGLTGLIERDPIGFRLIGPNGQGCRLIFGPTMDCTVEVDPEGPAGLLLRDPTGVRVISPDAAGESRLLFGPTDDCTIGIDPRLPGLIERDPTGFRLLGPGGQGCRLIFGPTLDCTVEVDPEGPDGLLLRDLGGIRLLNPDPQRATALRFGPSDECSLRIDPPGGLTGLIESDPNGLRLLGPGGQGCILTFGPTDLCRIFVDPRPELPGLNFSDPAGFFFNNDVTVAGTLVAQDFVQASSRRLKENIRPIDNALNKINRLQGVSFNWKPQKGGQADIGFIAEEVDKVLPELVTWDENHESAQGVKYANIVAVAVEGIKAQQKQIEDLQTENEALRKDFASLQSQMDDLSGKMGQLLSVGAE